MSRPLSKRLHVLAERVSDVAVREELHGLAYMIEKEFSKLRYRVKDLRGGVEHREHER